MNELIYFTYNPRNGPKVTIIGKTQAEIDATKKRVDECYQNKEEKEE